MVKKIQGDRVVDPALLRFVDNNVPKDVAVADVGSYNLNGAVKDVVSKAVGFDLLSGPGVDVVVAGGVIPEEHKGKYEVVTVISAIMVCQEPDDIKREIVDLLKVGGKLILSFCDENCHQTHTTSQGGIPTRGWTVDEVIGLLEPEIRVGGEVRVSHLGHGSVILMGTRTDDKAV